MKIARTAAAAAAGALLLATAMASADGAAKAEYKVLFENERVRVSEAQFAPGATHDMHSHPDHVVYALADSKVRFTGEDGKTSDGELTKGSARYVDAVTHKVDNVGTTPIHVVLVELKDAAKPE